MIFHCYYNKTQKAESIISPDATPVISNKPRPSITSLIRDTTESFRSRSKSRERVSIDKGSSFKKENKNKGVFSSTLSLFKKRERKKSGDDSDCEISVDRISSESISHADYHFQAPDKRKDDSVFISLHGDDDDRFCVEVC